MSASSLRGKNEHPFIIPSIGVFHFVECLTFDQFSFLPSRSQLQVTVAGACAIGRISQAERVRLSQGSRVFLLILVLASDHREPKEGPKASVGFIQ